MFGRADNPKFTNVKTLEEFNKPEITCCKQMEIAADRIVSPTACAVHQLLWCNGLSSVVHLRSRWGEPLN